MAIEIKDGEKFNTIAGEALAACNGNKRWIRAIWKAIEEIGVNGVFMDWDAEEKHLLIWSQSSDLIYTANGSCQCFAYQKGQPCWHRACARLVRLYMTGEPVKQPEPNHFAELVAERRYTAPASVREMNAAPYLPAKVGTQLAPAKFGRFRI